MSEGAQANQHSFVIPIRTCHIPCKELFDKRFTRWKHPCSFSPLQYGQTGAGFGYHDFRIIWFYDGKVTGITSYKDKTPASYSSSSFQADTMGWCAWSNSRISNSVTLQNEKQNNRIHLSLTSTTERYCTVLPINVPMWIIGLQPESWRFWKLGSVIANYRRLGPPLWWRPTLLPSVPLATSTFPPSPY